MNVEKALAFIKREGNVVERARLDYLLSAKRPSQEIVAQLFAGQRGDGGWAPFWAEDYSSLDATCFRLAQAEQLGMSNDEPAVKRAVDFLAERQAADGSWQEEDAVVDVAPPWAMPGDLASTLYLTANCGLWLALLHENDDKTQSAATHLMDYMGEDGNLPSFLQSHWLAAGLWRRLQQREPAARVFSYLETRLSDLPPGNLSWLLTTLSSAGVSTDEQLLSEAASLLEEAQDDDGRWTGEDGSGQDVHTTVEALRALHLCGRLVWK